jgi:hypothetical protein
MLRLKIYIRHGPKSSRYFDFCREYSQKLKEVSPEANKMWYGENWERISDEMWSGEEGGKISDMPYLYKALSCMGRSEELLIKSVIFAHLCLEAFIYDYAAHYFSDAYAKKHLDKLDFLSKWVLIPKLVTGRDFPKDSKAFEYLTKLNRYRNELIHPKSKPLIDMKNRAEFAKIIVPYIRKEVKSAIYIEQNPPFEMVMEVLAELRKLESDDIATQWWQLEEVDGSDIYFPEPNNN